jgi:hypothetical protein
MYVYMLVSFSVKFGLVGTTVSTCQVIIKHCTAQGIKCIYYKNIYLKYFDSVDQPSSEVLFKSPLDHPAKNDYRTFFSLHY